MYSIFKKPCIFKRVQMSIHLFVEIYAANVWKMIFFPLWKRMSEKEKGKNKKFKRHEQEHEKRIGTQAERQRKKV